MDLEQRIAEIEEEAYMVICDTAFVFRYMNNKICIVCYNFNDIDKTLVYSIRLEKYLLLEYNDMEESYSCKSQMLAKRNEKLLIEGALEWFKLHEK